MSHKIEEVANLGYDTASDSSRPQVDDGRKEEEMVHRHQVPVTKPMQVSKHPDKIESADTCSKREVKINTLCHYHKQPTVSSDNFIVPSADYSFPDYPPPPPIVFGNSNHSRMSIFRLCHTTTRSEATTSYVAFVLKRILEVTEHSFTSPHRAQPGMQHSIPCKKIDHSE